MAWLVSLLRCSTLYGDRAARVNRSLADSLGRRTKIVPISFDVHHRFFAMCTIDRRPARASTRIGVNRDRRAAARTLQHRERHRPVQVLPGAIATPGAQKIDPRAGPPAVRKARSTAERAERAEICQHYGAVPADPTSGLCALCALCGGSCFLADARTCEVRIQSMTTRLRSDQGTITHGASSAPSRDRVHPRSLPGRVAPLRGARFSRC